MGGGGEGHNDHHVIHVILWWRHGKQRQSGRPLASLSMQSGRELGEWKTVSE